MLDKLNRWEREEAFMETETLIMAAFIGVPILLAIAAAVAWFRTNKEFEIEET